MAAQRTMTFGVIVGNRGFFPDHLAKTGREEILSVLEAAGAKAMVLGPEQIKVRRGGNATQRRSIAPNFSRSMRKRLTASSLRCRTSAKSAASSMPSGFRV